MTYFGHTEKSSFPVLIEYEMELDYMESLLLSVCFIKEKAIFLQKR